MVMALALLASACSDRGPLGPQIEPAADGFRPFTSTATTDIGVFTGTIRIGVIPSAASVAVGSPGDYVVRDRVTGAVLMSGFGDQVSVSLAEGAVTYRFYRLQIQCAQDVSVLKARVEALGYRTYVFWNPVAKCNRLTLGEFDVPPVNTYAARLKFQKAAALAGATPGGSFWVVHTWTEGVTRYHLTRGSQTAVSSNPVIVTAAEGLVSIGSGLYRGTAEVARNSAGTLAGINELPMEQYLYGVVPKELGPTLYPELEALKAQAVAARTWALVGFRKRIADGYNLKATTDDQVYGGYAAEHPLSNQAVDETAGVVATYGGRPISTFYSSTSGGHTASFEEWLDGASPIAYLTGVPDAQRGRAFENVPTLDVFKSHANPTSLRNAAEGDWESNWARYHRWVFEWSNAEITSVVSAFARKDVGKVLAINVLERGPSGRVLKIEFVTEQGTFVSTRNGIRSALKFIGTNGTRSNLLSTLFFMEPVLDRRTKAIAGFKAYGGGYGHGVGMSQTGAVGMAERGKTYDEILKHYYQGIDLAKQY